MGKNALILIASQASANLLACLNVYKNELFLTSLTCLKALCEGA